MDFDKPQRKGHSGRIADKLREQAGERYENRHYTCPPELYARLVQYAADEERAHSWVIQKALDEWLTKKGY